MDVSLNNIKQVTSIFVDLFTKQKEKGDTFTYGQKRTHDDDDQIVNIIL